MKMLNTQPSLCHSIIFFFSIRPHHRIFHSQNMILLEASREEFSACVNAILRSNSSCASYRIRFNNFLSNLSFIHRIYNTNDITQSAHFVLFIIFNVYFVSSLYLSRDDSHLETFFSVYMHIVHGHCIWPVFSSTICFSVSLSARFTVWLWFFSLLFFFFVFCFVRFVRCLIWMLIQSSV